MLDVGLGLTGGQDFAAAGLGRLMDEPADEIDVLRSREYDLLASLLGRVPSPELLATLATLDGDDSPLGRAHCALAKAAALSTRDEIEREFFDLFIGVGRGELLPYASYYLTGFLNERPLARVRDDLGALGIAPTESHREPEDHIAVLLDVMSGLASQRFEVEAGAESRFFARHIEPWAERLFSDIENARLATFYKAVGALGRLFMEIEREAFTLDR